MEDVAVAYMLLEQSRSIVVYTEKIMVTLKNHIYVVDGTMVDAGADYWVLRITKDSLVIRMLSTDNPAFGEGLCGLIYKMLLKTPYHGEPCIKWELFTDPNSGQTADMFMINKRWIASVMGTVESAIVDALERLASEGDNTRVFADYDTEQNLVFPLAVRKTLANPGIAGALALDELRLFSKSQIQHGFCLLRERVDAETFQSLMWLPEGGVTAAIYRPGDTLGAVPSIGDIRGRYKIRTDVELPLVVSPRLWTERGKPARKNGDDEGEEEAKDLVSKFIQTLFLIAGGYEGKHITAGGTSAEIRNNHFTIKPGGTCRIVVDNPHYRPGSLDFSLYGDADDEDMAAAAAVGSDRLFPSSERELVLTEKSYFEAMAIKIASRRVATSPEIIAVFETAHGTNRPPAPYS
jgi:hypothetical protein